MKKIKYIHIMPMASDYNSYMVELINDNADYFDPSEHLFIVKDPVVYEMVRKYVNVRFEKDITHNAKIFKRYADMAGIIVLHENSLMSLKVLMKLPRRTLNKVVWVVWGHDLYPEQLATSLKRKVSNRIRKSISKHYRAIGVGFKYDALKVRADYGEKMKILPMPYYMEDYNIAMLNKAEWKKRDDKNLRVMIGHSAFEFLNHIEILDKLEKFKKENIKICLVLAYGRKPYSDKVKEYAIKKYGKDKVEIIDERMSKEEYMRYLSSIDICVLDYKHQAALGNLYILLYYGKKVFLNRNGMIKTAMDLENIETYNVDEIESMSFGDFSARVKRPKNGINFASFYFDKKNYLEMWQDTFKYLEKDL